MGFKMLQTFAYDAARWVGDLVFPQVEAFGREAGTVLLAVGDREHGHTQVNLTREESEALTDWLCKFHGWQVEKPPARHVKTRACVSCGEQTSKFPTPYGVKCDKCSGQPQPVKPMRTRERIENPDRADWKDTNERMPDWRG